MPTLKEIAWEWDRNASSRCRQLDSGQDISHDMVLLPVVLRLAGSLQGLSVLDVGCGCGFLTSEASRNAKRVLGIDISQGMIHQAELRHKSPNLSFKCRSLAALARSSKQRYDISLANMSLITMPNLGESLKCFSRLLKKGGTLVFSITHPCFWNEYRKDEWPRHFNYWRSHAVRAPFRITLDKRALPVRTTYFHRSLSQYFGALDKAKLRVERAIEPIAPKGAPHAYRESFRFPRFLVFRCRKA